MPDERVRKQIVLEYCRRINSGDVAGTLALFAPDVRYEDPVGSPVLTGRDAVGAHLAAAIRGHVHEVPGTPVASFDTEHVLLPASATLDGPHPAGSRLKVTFIALARIGPDELIHEMRFFWGRSDATPIAVGPLGLLLIGSDGRVHDVGIRGGLRDITAVDIDA